MRIAKVLGRNVRALREAKSLSQQVLAEKLGIDRANLSKLETGRANPLLSTVEDTARTLGVSPAKLLAE